MNASLLTDLRNRRWEILTNALEQNLLKSVHEFSGSILENLTIQVPKTNLLCVHVYQKDATLLVFAPYLAINKPAGFKTEVEYKGVTHCRSKQVKIPISLDYFIKKIPDSRLREIFELNYGLFTPEELR